MSTLRYSYPNSISSVPILNKAMDLSICVINLSPLLLIGVLDLISFKFTYPLLLQIQRPVQTHSRSVLPLSKKLTICINLRHIPFHSGIVVIMPCIFTFHNLSFLNAISQ